MGEETGNTMNLDLNLGPVDHPHDDQFLRSSPPRITLEEFIVWERRQRRQRWRSMQREPPVPPETRNLALELIGGGSGSQAGEASFTSEVLKTCDDSNGYLNDEASRKKEENEKANSDEISVFDCNICLDLAQEPVVTCCGHLFCWPCLYRWLNLHSDAKECPVCKGEVTMKTMTPIYGRGRSIKGGGVEGDSSPKIPHRPQARRFESWRQTIQRTAFTFPMEEMIRRLGSRFDLAQVQPPNPEDSRESPERRNSLLARILTSRGMRREQNQNPVPTSDDATVDLTDPSNSDAWDSGRLPSLLRRISNPNRDRDRAPSISSLASAFSSAERLVETYFRTNPFERTQEQHPPVDDRDSVSSIAAMIHSESQTVDTTIEIDSTVSLTASSSGGRRNNDAGRVADVDSGDSRPPRRRRLY
ncbi:PREDICTED: E3 ubiquitin-protein ligase rnf146-like [Ipomoea nil]|uniref:E3 ubiquitin-protein ligase rnf146-like n=1 Tax=Ipomoea nil TaxID=35883 RepID=UPI000901A194|nr:PREDICTED: E3 ubiquitin-protein ligase rnf146-like [Ipomoea nil]